MKSCPSRAATMGTKSAPARGLRLSMKADSMGSGSFGFGGKKTYTKSFGLPSRPDEVTVRITSYAKTEVVTVPLKLSIGMGLR